MGVEPLKDVLLNDDGADSSRTWGLGRRAVVMGSAIAGCFFLSGLVFGFSAIVPELIAAGVFHDRCHGEDSAKAKCGAQYQALGSMFTLATSMLNIVTLVSGAILDNYGPRFTAAGAALLTGIGCMVFSLGGHGNWEMCYNVGFFLMGISGPAFFVSSLSFPNLFPGMEGRFTAALVGCFDASSAVFLILSKFMRDGASLQATFAGYVAIPFAIVAEALYLWPREAIVERKPCDDDDDGITISSPLARIPLSKQVRTLEYWLLTWTVSINMVVLNFFIATAVFQMEQVDFIASPALAYLFSVCLPAGGVVFIPVIGKLVDQAGPTVGFAVLWVCFLLFELLNIAYALTAYAPLAYAAFIVFALCRPLFYTLYAAFVGQLFGFATFGTLYGLLTTIAGFVNFAVAPLTAHALQNGFMVTNLILMALQVSTMALPAVVLWRARKRGAALKALSMTSPGSPGTMEIMRQRCFSPCQSPIITSNIGGC